MLLNEGVKNMYSGFINIINKLKSLVKFYSNEKIVIKLLRTLLRNKRGSRDTHIIEAYNLKNLKLEDLVRELLNYEIYL